MEKLITACAKLCFISLFIFSSLLFTPCRAQLTITPSASDIPVSPLGVNACHVSEIHISIDKTNPQYLILSANAENAIGLYSTSSMDAGIHWSPDLDFFTTGNECYGDPATAIDANGNMYVATGNIYNRFGNADAYYLAVSKPLTHGSSFTVNTSTGITATAFDKDMLAVDDEISSPYSGNVYCAFTDFATSTINCSVFSGGNFIPQLTLWDNKATPQGNNRYTGYGVNIQTGPNGYVYACWAVYDQTSHILNADGLGFCYSTDGGNTFINNTSFANPYVFLYNGYDNGNGSGSDNNFGGVLAPTRMNCFPSMAIDKSCLHKGRIYIAYAAFDYPNHPLNRVIQLRYTDDITGASGWQGPFTISASTNKTNYFFPWVTVDDVTGIVSVVYYATDNSSWSTDTWMASSYDGGLTYTNQMISHASHILGPIGYPSTPSYAGDYIGIAAHNNKVYPAWMDNRFTANPNHYWRAYVNPVTIGPIEVMANTTWNQNPMVIPADVEVTPGNTLTIPTGTVVEMFAGHTIFVDPGATLIVNGTITIGGCGQMWNGIDVEGTASKSQSTPGVQGRVILNPGSQIEYALNGITTAKPNGIGGYDLTTTGGVITANGAKFYNCQRAIQYLYYTDINRPTSNDGIFTSCTFEVDNLYPSYPGLLPYPLQPAVSMWGVHGITFYGNTFANNMTSISNASQKGTGIASVDASYAVTNCNVINVFTGQCGGAPNTFTGYEYGINAANSNPVNTISIIGTHFTNNFSDIDMQGVDYLTINQNTFLKNQNVGSILFCLGCLPDNIYLNQCTGYSVQENSFTVNGTGPDNAYGIISNINGPFDNLIYNNSFSGLYVGCQAQGTNGAVSLVFVRPPNPPMISFAGLQYQCNQFTSNTRFGADIAVTSGLIDPLQGVCTNSTTTANNTFNYTCSSVSRDNLSVYPSISPMWEPVYSYPTVAAATPACTFGAVVLNNCSSVSSITCSATAPSQNGNGSPFGNINNLNVALTGFESQVNTLNGLITGGDAPSLYAAIKNDNPGQVQSALLAPGPYLSDSLLKSLLNAGLPPGTLKNIVVPNSPFDSSVLSTFNKISLPPGIRKQIQSAQTGISSRTEIQMDIAYNLSQENNVINSEIRYYLNDSAANALDSAELLIQSIQPAPSCAQLAQLGFIQLANGEYSAATSTLATVKGMGDPTMSDYCQLLPILIELQQNPLNIMGLQNDSATTGTVTTIANDSNTFGSVNAQALLNYVFNRQFSEPIEPLPRGHRMEKGNNIAGANDDTTVNGIFKLYPNPANNRLTIEYRPDNSTNAETNLIIYDVLGKKVVQWNLPQSQTIITEDISSLPAGFYLYNISVGNNMAQRGKIIIAR